MSAALTHVAMGLLLGLALRLRLRWVPVAGLLALLPDLDHLSLFTPIPVWVLVPRTTFHNLLFCVVAPLAIFFVLRWRKAPDDVMRLGVAAPLLMTSHLFLDMLPLDVSSARVPLLYPWSGALYTASARKAAAIDPTAFSTVTMLLLILVALVVGTVVAMRRRETSPGSRSLLAAFVGGWLLAFPILAAGGFLIPAPLHPDTNLHVDSPTVLLPQGRVSLLVFELGGNDVAKGAVLAEWWAAGARIGSVANPAVLTRGDVWPVTAELPASVVGAVTVRLVAKADGFVYEERAAAVKLGHFETTLALADYRADGQGSASVRVSDAGGVAVAPGHLRLVVTASDGTELANATNPETLPAAGTWAVSFRAPPTALANAARIVVTSPDDGFTYLRESRTPTVGPGGT